MATLREAVFTQKVTTIHRDSIDRLISLADSDKNLHHQKLVASLDEDDGQIDTDEFHALYYHWPKMAFSLYALSIIHCYSILENNRKLICQRLPGLTNGQLQNLHDTRVVKQCLQANNINHERIRCYKTMNEFRIVNNAIKHDRYSLSTSITADNRKTYEAKQLRSLYLNRAIHLETYLADLFKRVNSLTNR